MSSQETIITSQITEEDFNRLNEYNPKPDFEPFLLKVHAFIKKRIPKNATKFLATLSWLDDRFRIDGTFDADAKNYKYYFTIRYTKTGKYILGKDRIWDITPPPKKSIDEFIKEVEAVDQAMFDEYSDFMPIAYNLLEGVDLHDIDFPKSIPFIFDLVERFHDYDFGAPGPLVHALEESGNYEVELVKSLNRQPSVVGLDMLCRIIYKDLTDTKGSKYLQLAKNIHASADKNTHPQEFLQMRFEQFKELGFIID